MSAPQTPVLVTGGGGFIAAHCIARLLEDGYPVRTTVRSLARADAVRQMVGRTGQDASGIQFVVADLGSDAGWAEALDGCDYVLHVASPIPHGEPKNPDEVIGPAREGALRVLSAAHAAGVRRVVLTSAFGAVGFGYGRTEHVFTEDDWSILDGPGVDTYNVSKTLAERAAWDYVRDEGAGLELVALCPVAVFGPVLGGSLSGGNNVIRGLLAGDFRALFDFWFPVVDVRDVATAHVLAMTTPDAAGERFIIGTGEGLTMGEIARELRRELGAAASRVPTRQIPTPVIRALAKVVKPLRVRAAQMGITKTIDVSKARRLLGLQTRPPLQTVVDCARSIVDLGLATPRNR